MAPSPPRACARCRRRVPIHARGLCGNCYKQHRNEYPRTKYHRPFSARERELLRANWGKMPAKEIAAKLGRKVRDTYAAAVRFGITQPKPGCPKTNTRLRKRMVALHGEGYSDREIAEIVGFGHGTVIRWLRRLGLPSNCRQKPTDPFPERWRKKQSAAAHRRIEEEGLEFAVGFMKKHLDGRIEAMDMGWPQTNTLLEARILESLYQHGASTRLQIAEDVGGGTWTAQVVRDLKRRGFVAVLYRQDKYCVYGLAFGLTKTWERA